MKKLYLLLLIPSLVQAQKITTEKLQSVSEKYAVQSFKEFYDLLSLPNDAHYPENPGNPLILKILDQTIY